MAELIGFIIPAFIVIWFISWLINGYVEFFKSDLFKWVIKKLK